MQGCVAVEKRGRGIRYGSIARLGHGRGVMQPLQKRLRRSAAQMPGKTAPEGCGGHLQAGALSGDDKHSSRRQRTRALNFISSAESPRLRETAVEQGRTDLIFPVAFLVDD